MDRPCTPDPMWLMEELHPVIHRFGGLPFTPGARCGCGVYSKSWAQEVARLFFRQAWWCMIFHEKRSMCIDTRGVHGTPHGVTLGWKQDASLEGSDSHS